MIEIKFDKNNNKSIAYDVDTKIGECEFIEQNECWNIIYTEVSSLYQGQGIARRLVENIIENAKQYNKKLVAECSYAKKVIEDSLIQKLWDYMKLNQNIEKADCIIGLGCEDINIAKEVVKLYFDGYSDKIFFSGGLGKVTREIWKESEADKFAKYAIENGVPKENIYIENKSTNTGDNFRFIKSIIEQKGLEINSCIVVCKPYVEKRVYATLKKIMPQCNGIITSQKIEYKKYLKQYKEEFGDSTEVKEDLVGSVERMDVFAKRGWQIEMDIPEEIWQAYEQLVELGYDKYSTKKHNL